VSALSNINKWKIKGKVPAIDRMEKVIDNEEVVRSQKTGGKKVDVKQS
jgi:hypothetical protein